MGGGVVPLGCCKSLAIGSGASGAGRVTPFGVEDQVYSFWRNGGRSTPFGLVALLLLAYGGTSQALGDLTVRNGKGDFLSQVIDRPRLYNYFHFYLCKSNFVLGKGLVSVRFFRRSFDRSAGSDSAARLFRRSARLVDHRASFAGRSATRLETLAGQAVSLSGETPSSMAFVLTPVQLSQAKPKHFGLGFPLAFAGQAQGRIDRQSP